MSESPSSRSVFNGVVSGPAGRRLRVLLAALLITALVAGCGGTGSSSSTTTVKQAGGVSANVSSLQQSYVDVIAHVAPEVVQISTPHGLGSGVVLDGHGNVVTNAHVVADSGPFQVTDSRGRRYQATLVGTFAPDDLAVVHAEKASLPAAKFADSRKLHVGDIVLAVGNPLGLRSSVTNGIVSALGRTVPEPTGAVLPNIIQTSAPINPGNSGGALVNLAGEVVGIPTLAATDPQLGGGAAPGIGFAIPSDLVSDIAHQIVAHGHVVNSHRAFLGVQTATGVSGGAVVVAVEQGSPAQQAGIEPGDQITAVAGKRVGSAADLAAALAGLAPHQKVSVTIVTPNGSRRTVHVTLGQYPGG
jgi:putative serine protease PepD